jgi:hypothetical protein
VKSIFSPSGSSVVPSDLSTLANGDVNDSLDGVLLNCTPEARFWVSVGLHPERSYEVELAGASMVYLHPAVVFAFFPLRASFLMELRTAESFLPSTLSSFFDFWEEFIMSMVVPVKIDTIATTTRSSTREKALDFVIIFLF